MRLKGTELFVKALRAEGVDTIFGYPGGYVLNIFDELYKQNDIRLILPRHEQAAVHAADGYARSTGKVGVVLATSGPGATNLVTGIATANYDSVPLVCFTGQVPLGIIGNDAFQEVDIIGITRSICKYGVMVRRREDLGRIIKEAFYIARTGKPGPVVIDLPSDVMKEIMDDSYPQTVNIRGYKPNTTVHVGQLKRAVSLLKHAQRPLFLVGGGVNIAGANDVFQQLVEKTGVPAVTTVMGKGALPDGHPLYVGCMGMHGCYAANKAASECDLLFSIGTRFNDRITGKISEFAKHAKIVHIDIDTSAISRNISVDIPVVGDARLAVEKMLDLVSDYRNEQWLETIRSWQQEHPLHVDTKRGVNPQKIIQAINDNFEDFILTTDVGQHQMWVHQFLKLNGKRHLLTSGGLGTMGYGLPSAVGAQLGNPDRLVFSISGDGGFQMNMAELATAVAQRLPVVTIVFNNTYLGMVRQQQQFFCNKRYCATCLKERVDCDHNCAKPHTCPPYLPDFVKLAQAYGIPGLRVTQDDGITEALKQAVSTAQSQRTPVLVEFMLDRFDVVLPTIRQGAPISSMILEV